MQAQLTELAEHGICVARGYGIKITVQRGHLIVHDGTGQNRQTRRYHRVTSKLKRLVLIGHTGYITLETLRWLADVGAALVQIDSGGRVLTTSTTHAPGHAALRRSQALAATSPKGLEIARELLTTKVSGQASLLPELPAGPAAQAVLAQALNGIATAPDLRTLVAAEADAARAYWHAWSPLSIPIGRDPIVPAHWLTFGQRHSLLGNGPRLASNPPNAILNYLYALLEAETTLALHTVGLDPQVGIFHTDQRNRDSLALDAMEAVRPIVDAYVLAMLTQRTLSCADFVETRQGACRLTPQLATRLASTISTWRHHVAPISEGIAQSLAGTATSVVAIAAPLTRAQHAAAWNNRAPARTRRQPRAATLALPNTCRDCGTQLPDRRLRYCEYCRHERWARNASTGRDNAADVLSRLRAEQQDPAHGGRAAEIRGRKNAAHQRAVGDWQGERPDPAIFSTQIQPSLRDLPIQALVAVSGLSEHYCSLIRLGKKVPHARHWEALSQFSGPLEEARGFSGSSCHTPGALDSASQ